MSRSFSTANLAALLAVSFSVSSCTRQQPVQAKQEAGPIAINAAPVTSKEVRRIVQSVGTLFPFDEGVVSAEIDGRVTEVNADLGDKVNKGQVLVRSPMKSKISAGSDGSRSCVWRWSASDFGTRTIE